jgi:ABC-type multidrug transport system ATPase subunit
MGEAIIEVRNLSSFTAVDNISFDYKGEILVFLGQMEPEKQLP